LEGHGSEYNVMIGHESEAVHGSESYIYIYLHALCSKVKPVGFLFF